jgi:hypothetical protein
VTTEEKLALIRQQQSLSSDELLALWVSFEMIRLGMLQSLGGFTEAP